ncbi:MAG: DUF501 domain-containing protein [Halieaceae bacterium]
MDHINTAMRARVDELLGREARGLRDIPVQDAAGQPQVIQVASLVADKPFPTLFWLIDPQLSYRIDQLEAGGLIAELQQRIDESSSLQKSMREDHERHIRLRNSLMTDSERKELQALGYYDSLQKRGIGGIENFSRIRCLHTWYAAHLVEPNTIGRLLHEVFSEVQNSPLLE